MGTSSVLIFANELREGRIDLPWVPALVVDMYKAYVIWARREGFYGEEINRFSPAFRAFAPAPRRSVRVPAFDNPSQLDSATEFKVAPRRVFLIGEPLWDVQREKFRVRQGVQEFHDALTQWRMDRFVHRRVPSVPDVPRLKR